jgi:class 3 adenylate cyclase
MAASKDTPATKKAGPPPAPRPAPPAPKAPIAKAPPAATPSAAKAEPAPKSAAKLTRAGTWKSETGVIAQGMNRETLVIMFIDLARFQIASRRVKDADLVGILESFYDWVVDSLKPVGGRIVKFMGDGALVVFAADDADEAVRAVLELKAEVDTKLAERSFVTPLVARVHVGEVMAGSFGPKGDKRYDVIGQAVNRTAAMKLGEVVSLTADAYGRLDASTKELFKPKGDYYVPE